MEMNSHLNRGTSRRYSTADRPRPVIESNSSGSSFKRGLRRVGNKLKGGSANDAESGQSGVMLKPDELDPLQMRSEHEKLGQDSSGERAGLPLQGGTTDPAQDGRKLALPSNSDGNWHNTTRNLLQAQADGMRPDILETSSDGHLGSLSASIDPQYLSLDESSHDRQAETASIQPIASQGTWPRDQARIKDTPSTQINRKPMARGDPSYSVKAVSEVIPAIELNDNDKLDKSQGGIHSESHLSSLTDRYTPTGLVSNHQATITSANSKTRDTNFVVTNNLCDNCCDLETKLGKRDKIISDLKNLIENLENLTKHLESEKEDSAAREKDLKDQLQQAKENSAAREKNLEDQLQQAKDLIQRKLSEKGGPIVRQTIPGVGLLPDSEIILRWKNLCWSLRQHVTSHIAIPSRQFIQAESHDRGRLAALQNITPTFTLFLRSKNDCIDIVQAVIWDTLTNYIFASRGCSSWVYWSGNIHDTLKATSKMI
jgi:ribosomal protein S15P/S13E